MKKLMVVAMVCGLGGLASAGDPKDAKAPAKAMEMPKAPQEVADMAKMASGTWNCTGKAYMPDNSAVDMKGTMKSKSDMNGFWMHDSWTSKMGKMDFNFESYTTYDASMKKWRRMMVDSMGGQMMGTSDGMNAGKMDFAMDAWSAMGQMMFKDHLDVSDMKAGMKSWGERSMDKGKTWQKDYEVVCKK
jgi:hypothetical protein